MNENDEVADYDDEIYEEEDVQETGNATEEHTDGMKKRMQEMEEELDRLNKMQQQVEKQISTAADSIDEKSIYVGQVDYEATPEELRAHFAPCGTINRVTIMCDKITGHPKG
jgi:polyadenylate-binding protein 2